MPTPEARDASELLVLLNNCQGFASDVFGRNFYLNFSLGGASVSGAHNFECKDI